VKLSNASRYALLALIELATHYPSGESLQIRQIAALQDIPDRYLEQILATLRRCRLIKGIRGAHGGYILAREASQITLLDAIGCVEGLDTVAAVSAGDPKTVDSDVVEEIWQEASEAVNSVLQKYTLQDLCERRAARQPKAYMYYI